MALFYLVLSTLRIACQTTKFGSCFSALYHLQQIIIPSLLITHLNAFSPSSSNTEAREVWLASIQPWRWFVQTATPVFTVLEGFCTLLALQTAGRVSSWLIRRKSADTWIIAQLLASACVFSTSMYVLYRIAWFTFTLNTAAALGSAWVTVVMMALVLAVTAAVAVCGIISEKGNSVESALLFAYIVYCLYFTVADFRPVAGSESVAGSMSGSGLLYFLTASAQADLPQVSSVLINGYASIAKLVPAGFKTVFQFLHGAVSTVTPSVFISLGYRLGVLFAATRIMPAVQKVSHSRKNSAVGLHGLPLHINPAADSEKQMRMALTQDADDEFNFEYDYKPNYDYGCDSHNSSSNTEDEDDETAVFEYDELDTALLNQKLALYAPGEYSFPPTAETLSATYTPLSPSPRQQRPPLQRLPPRVPQSRSRFETFQFLIFAYAPCILIAVYTHLLMQHLLLFNPSASTSSFCGADTSTGFTIFAWPWPTSSPRATWQFWGWVNMFTTLALYSLELVYGQTVNREEVIDYHWNLI